MADAFDPQQLRKYTNALKRYPRLLAAEMRRALEISGQSWHRSMVKRTGQRAVAFPRKKLVNRLSRRSGMLTRSLRVEMGPNQGTQVSMALTSRGTAYAATQEFGATITPKKAKRLWIPLEANMTPTGRTRKSPRALMQKKHELAFIGNSKGGITVFWNKGQHWNLPASMRKLGVPMYYLAKKVTIPGPKSTGSRSRFGFFDTWNNRLAADKRRREFERAIYKSAMTAIKQSGGAA